MKMERARKFPGFVYFFLYSVFAFCLCGTVLSLYGLADRAVNADVAVVLGNEVLANGKPHPRLAARLDRALALFRNKHCPLIIVSGGIGRSGHSEAEVMASYLKENGVPSRNIVRDVSGVNTWETARFTATYMREYNLTSAVAVSQFFHVARSAAALGFMGVEQVGTASPWYFEWRDVYSVAREVPGFLWYCCRGLARFFR